MLVFHIVARQFCLRSTAGLPNRFSAIGGLSEMKMRSLIILLLSFLLSVWLANALKMLPLFKVFEHQPVGYGLVVGLPGTGEQSPFTEQSFRTMLSNFGIMLPGNLKPKLRTLWQLLCMLLYPPLQNYKPLMSLYRQWGKLRAYVAAR